MGHYTNWRYSRLVSANSRPDPLRSAISALFDHRWEYPLVPAIGGSDQAVCFRLPQAARRCWPNQKMLWGGESSERVRLEHPGEGTHPMHQETFELNCSRTSLAMDGTLVVVVEMSLSTWLVCAEVPGLERRAMKKMSVDEAELRSSYGAFFPYGTFCPL